MNPIFWRINQFILSTQELKATPRSPVGMKMKNAKIDIKTPSILISTAFLGIGFSSVATAGSDTATASVQIVEGTSVTAVQDMQFGAILNGLDSGNTETITLQPDGTYAGNATNISSVNDTVDGTQAIQAAVFTVESEDDQTKTGQTITIEVTQDFTPSANGGTAPSLTGLDANYTNSGNLTGTGTSISINSANIPDSATENLQVGATLEVSADTAAGTYDDALITVTSNFE